MTSHELELTGLDGQNPLGFLAAIGLLRILDEDAERRELSRPTLAYAEGGEAIPTLRSHLALDELVAFVLEDARAQGDNRALQLAYTDDGTLVPGSTPGATRDLKPPAKLARAFHEACAAERPRVAGLAAAWFSELVQDRSGDSSKPTAFHFTAGQQSFLTMIEALRVGITDDDVREAIVGPWRNVSELPSLTWDASVARYYALRAGNPAKEKRGSVAAANWLAVHALEAFPVVARRDRLITTAVEGGWKDSSFTWPIWSARATFRSIASLLRIAALRWTTAERDALGIVRVYRAQILRSDQGGYGSFTPASVALPRGRRPD